MERILPDADTVQGMLARSRGLRPDPVSIALPDGSTREVLIIARASVSMYGGSGSVELRAATSPEDYRSIAANVTVYLPEVGWTREGGFPITPAYVTHSSGGTGGRADSASSGETEATILLLRRAVELRNLLNAEAEVALAPIRDNLLQQEREQEERWARESARHEAIRARLRSFLLEGRSVRVTTTGGQRVQGNLTLDERISTVIVGGSGPLDKQKRVSFKVIALFEVKGQNGRFQPFELEPKAVTA